MSTAAFVTLVLQGSLALLVFAVGLKATPADTFFLPRHEGLFARSLLSMNVIMPLLALLVAVVFSLKHEVELALIAMAISPVPPFLPLKTAKAGGTASYMVSLLVTESLLAIVLVPFTMWFFGSLFGASLYVSPLVVARIVVIGILVPVLAGIIVRRVSATLADRIAKPANMVAIVFLFAGVLPLVVKLWRPMVSLVGDGTLLAIVALALAGLAIGHVLGGPERAHRPVLALATATRHPAVAIAALKAAFPNETHAPAAVILALITAAVVSLPYVKWSRSRVTRQAETASRRGPVDRRSAQRPLPTRPARRRSDRRV
jgi:BASS family bile acid:Na+ symporter